MSTSQEKRRWYQFSLLSLLVLMTLAAVGAGVWAYQIKLERERQAAISRVIETVEAFDGVFVEDARIVVERKGLKGERLTTFLDDLQWWEGLRSLHLAGSEANDQSMKQLAKLRRLEGINLRATQITDEGLSELTDLTDLIWINVEYCAVTDKGLVQISKLSKLEYLEIEGTQITPAGIRWIKEARPNLEIIPKSNRPAPMDAP